MRPDDASERDREPQADELLRLYEQMLLIRRSEERLAAGYAAGKVPGALASLHRPGGGGGRRVRTSRRSRLRHVDPPRPRPLPRQGRRRGGDVRRDLGQARGHLPRHGRVDARRRPLEGDARSANGVVGAGLAIATGAALGAQLDGDGKMAVCFFGDGAANQGVLMETLNVAAIWGLPMIFVCENNTFSEFTPSSEITAGRIGDRARAFDIPRTRSTATTSSPCGGRRAS